MSKRRKRIVRLAVAFVKNARGRTDTSEIEAYGGVSQREKCFCERIDDLVVERTAFERKRMRNERDTGKRREGRVDDNFERAGSTVDNFTLGRLGRQMRSLSTTLPPTTCELMISSISCRSTYVYQIASG